MRALIAALVLVVTTGISACASTGERDGGDQERRAPDLQVTEVVGGLDIPWDVQPITRGRLLVTERDSQRLLLVRRNGTTRSVTLHDEQIWSSGETGLMGLEVDPRFRRNRTIYTCSGWDRPDGGHDVRVIRWQLSNDLSEARQVRTLVQGLPITSGRHGGCRLLIARNGALVVGTGDAAQSDNPQDRRSLGGKTLRLDRTSGKAWRGNPWARARSKKRYVFTYGHRNVQGLAQRSDGTLWSVEHGSYRDDEVNLLRGGRNFGWDPGPGYDESVPMTDHGLPGKQWNARWRSGTPTIATSGAAFVPKKGWRGLGGTLAVAALGGERLLFLTFDDAGMLQRRRVALRGEHGRLRSVSVASDGALLITTSNGGGNDQVLRVTLAR